MGALPKVTLSLLALRNDWGLLPLERNIASGRFVSVLQGDKQFTTGHFRRYGEILNSIVLKSHFGMLRGKISIYLPPKHNTSLKLEFKMVAVSPKRFIDSCARGNRPFRALAFVPLLTS